jgi:enamine deaminase RidA (YjgF/YER057c/UK114 family)
MSTITHINPEDLHTSPVFSQGTLAETGRTLYVGGQNGTGPDGAVVAGGFAEQTTQAMKNVLSVLEAAKAGPEQVAKLNVYIAADADLNEGFGAFGAVWGNHPTAVTVLRVAGFARPEVLVEIDAIALVD